MRLRFPSRKDPQRHLENTLFDSEMVTNKTNEFSIPRYFGNDIIRFEGDEIGYKSSADRLFATESLPGTHFAPPGPFIGGRPTS